MIDRVVILNDVSVARGGATGLALASVRHLRAAGIPVTFITGDDGNNPELQHLGVEVLAMRQHLLLDAGIGTAFIRGLYNPRTIKIVGGWIDRNDTPGTVYHIHTWAKILSPSLFKALRPVASRLAVSAHDFFLVCPNGGYVLYNTGRVCELTPLSAACVITSCDRRSYGHKLWRVARQAIRSMLFDLQRTPPLVLAIHDGMRAGLERGGVPADAIRVLRNPIQPFTIDRIEAEHNNEAIFIGRLHPEKGADLAAAAARRAGIRLRIIGSGPMFDQITQEYPEVRLEGQLSHDEMATIAKSARLLIMPSRYPEPFGLVAGEALWSGLPVLLSDTAMMANEIVQRGAGVACDFRSEAAVTAIVQEIFRNDARTKQMSCNAFQATRDLGNTPDQWTGALISIYRGLSPRL